MSDDLYDSLEDECNDERGSSNSLDLLQTKLVSVKRVSKLESINGLSSFCFGKNLNEETDFSSSTKEVSVNASHKNNFLPIINNKNSMPGLQELFNHSADYETLAKKGLLLNRDGSFTKSVSDAEELPFITREYKNLVFQKRKMYNTKRQGSLVKNQKTTPVNEKKTSNCDLRKGGGSKKCVEAVQNSFEEKNLTFDKNSATNLTDSMKRVLLQNKNAKMRQQSLEKTNGRQNAKSCVSETGTLKDRLPGRTETNDLKPLNKHLPQFAPNTQKQRLTYLERQQLRNGYSPMFLRHGIKKITSETTRSNFGDSVAGKLSSCESSRVLSAEDLTDSEAEEKFYKEIIERDKSRGVKARRSNVVVGVSLVEDVVHGSAVGSGSLKDLEKLRGTQRSGGKQNLKPLSIDIKPEGEQPTKKCSHYCSKNPSPKMSKIELALKGKTYGYLANARNIFKFKSRAEEKLSGREDLSPKFNGHKQASETTLHTQGYIKKSLPTLNLAKKVRSGLERSSGRRLYDGAARNVECYEVGERQKPFYLPHVSSSEHRDCKINSKKLIRINSCLYCPGYQNKDEITVH